MSEPLYWQLSGLPYGKWSGQLSIHLRTSPIYRESGHRTDLGLKWHSGTSTDHRNTGRLHLPGIAGAGNELARGTDPRGSELRREDSCHLSLHSRFLANYDRDSAVDKYRIISDHPDGIQGPGCRTCIPADGHRFAYVVKRICIQLYRRPHHSQRYWSLAASVGI